MTDCAAPRHGAQDDPSPAEAHATLCRPCRVGLSRDLRRLPALHTQLEHIPATRGGDGSGLPFSEPAADCRSQIRHDLTWWARRITKIRGEDAPPVMGDDWSANPVAAMCGWLHPQVSRSSTDPGWICFRDWAPDMAGAIADNRSRAAALLDPWLVKHVELPGADGVCLECAAGRMTVTIYVWPEDSRKSFIGCTECPVVWEFGEAWLPFLKRLKQRRDAA